MQIWKNWENEPEAPTLAALEWVLRPQSLELPPEAVAKMRDMVATPAKANERLKVAAKRQGR